MIFDELGLPKDSGATDFNDSARLAGIMVLFDHPLSQCINLQYYVDGLLNSNSIDGTFKYVRHPKENTYDFSRDQAVCLMSGFYNTGEHWLADKRYITGKDFLSPSVKGHITRCQSGEGTWFQNIWLKLDILYNAYFDPMSEPNQLICMLEVAGPEYVKMWTKHNKKWREAIREYWSGWRGESELAEFLIKELEEYV